MMKYRLLFLLLFLGGIYQYGFAQTQEFKVCRYKGPELSFGFRYPFDMKEQIAVRPHIKKMVVTEGSTFGFSVNIFEFGSDAAATEREMMQMPITELKEVLMRMVGGEDYKTNNIEIKDVVRGYVIDRLPAIFISQMADFTVLDRTETLTEWSFLFFYKTKLVQVVGTSIMGVESDLDRFLAIAATFSVTSQYEN